MQQSDWEQVVAQGYRFPHGATLDELTTDLVAMLSDTDPHVRDDIAHEVLCAWINEGIYDDLLIGLGDGLLHGLRSGLGESETPSVLRRSFSASVLAAIIARDNTIHIIHPTSILTWADHVMSWLLREQDVRHWSPEYGWIRTLTHSADVIGALSASRHVGVDELTVILDVIAERLTKKTQYLIDGVDSQILAYATMSILHRDLVSIETTESWLSRIAHGYADLSSLGPSASAPEHNTAEFISNYLQALHVQLLLGVHGTPAQNISSAPSANPAIRCDLLLALQNVIRTMSPWIYRQASS